MRTAFKVIAVIVGAYLVVRAVVEPFVIDFSDPSTYETDWGGPSLVGVLAVHMVPGVVAAVLFVTWFVRARRARRPS